MLTGKRNIFVALVLVVALFLLFRVASAPATRGNSFEWWNTSWRYRVGFNVTSPSYDRTNWPVEMWMNFSKAIYDIKSDYLEFDNSSLRLVEYNSTGSVVWDNAGLGASSQFDELEGYNETYNATGVFSFQLNGTTGSDETRYFFIYFDTKERAKATPSYTDEISYAYSGDEFYVNNSMYWVYVDTNRSEYTSGIYRVNMSDGGPLLWAPAGQRTGEFTQLNRSDSQLLGFDLESNYTLLYSGPGRYVVEQRGPEVLWDSDTPTDNGTLIKRYYFYPGVQWIKIEQIFEAHHSIVRQTKKDDTLPFHYPGFVTLDHGRVVGHAAMSSSGYNADPFTWAASPNVATYSTGLGVININETGTSNFGANADAGADETMGIRLAPTSLSNGDVISETAVVYFNNETSKDPITDLVDRFRMNINISVEFAEEWNATSETGPEFNYYNRNETMFIYVNITDDYYSLVSYVNVTLNQTSEEIELYDDGTNGDSQADDGLYTVTYNFSDTAPLGVWNLSADMFDYALQFLNASWNTTILTDFYNVNITIQDPNMVVEREAFVNLTVFNYRNDTGVNFAKINCTWNGTWFEPEIVSNDTFGNYVFNFTAPSYYGDFNLNCSAARNTNIGYGNDTFHVEEENTTLTTHPQPEQYTATQVIANTSESFMLNITLNNTDNGTAYYVNLTVVAEPDWLVNGTLGTFSDDAGNITDWTWAVRYFNITVPEKTVSGNYTINSTTIWTNPDGSSDNSTAESYVDVESHVLLERTPDLFEQFLIHGHQYHVGNFTLNSTGNDPVVDMVFNVTGGNYTQNPGDFAIFVEYEPPTISSMVSGEQQQVAVNLTVPAGFPPGVYLGNITINSTNSDTGNLTIELNTTVPQNRTWDATPLYCATTATQPTGTVCIFSVDNTGNVLTNFTVRVNFTETPIGLNGYTYPNVTEFNLSAQDVYPVAFLYDATGASEGSFVTNYTVNATSSGPIPQHLNVTVNLTTFLGPRVNFTLSQYELPQNNTVFINATIEDRSVVNISYSFANITMPDGSFSVRNMTLNFSFISGSTGFNTTYWYVTFPIEAGEWWGTTEQLGNYSVFVTSFDYNNIDNSDNDTFAVYTNVTVVSKPLQNYYNRERTGTILYNVTFLNHTGIQGVNSAMRIIKSDGYLLQQPDTLTSNENGTVDPLPTFSIEGDAPLGTYNVVTNSTFYDSFVGMIVNTTVYFNFIVEEAVAAEELSADINTQVVWYPSNTMTQIMVVYRNYVPVQPDSMNLTIYEGDPRLNQVFATHNLTDMSEEYSQGYPYYIVSDTAPSTSGPYWALLSVSRGSLFTFTEKPFRVATGGPYDVYVWPNFPEVEPGNYLPFTLTMWNMGEYGQDVHVTWWLSDAANTTQWHLREFDIYTPPGQNTTAPQNTTTTYISDSIGTGEYYINVEVNYSYVEPVRFARASFDVVDIVVPVCGDGICNGDETALTCPADCYCGDGVCDSSEDYTTCPADCGAVGPGPAPGPGPAVPTGRPQINLTNVPTEINIVRGSVKDIVIGVQNTGIGDIYNLTVNITGVAQSWIWSIRPELVENLTQSGLQLFTVVFNIPAVADTKTYDIDFLANSAEAIDIVSSLLRVFVSDEELYQHDIDTLRERLTDLRSEAEVMEIEGYDVGTAFTLLDQTGDYLDSAQDNLDAGNINDAIFDIRGARNILEDVERILSEAVIPPTPPILLEAAPLWFVFILILLVLVLIAVIYLYLRNRQRSRVLAEMYAKRPEKEYRKEVAKKVAEKPGVSAERAELQRVLATLKSQHDEGLLSNEVYQELREKNEERLRKMGG